MWRIFLLVVGSATVLGCESAGAPAATLGTVDAGADADKACGAPPGKYVDGTDPPAHCVKEVTGRLQDSAARPLAGVAVSVCGAACFGAVTDGSGGFRVPVNARLPDSRFAFFAHARPRHASIIVPLPNAPPERLELATVVEVPPLSMESAALPADGAATPAILRIGPLTLGVPEGTSFQLSFEDATDDVEGRLVRFAMVPKERAPAFAAGAELVYALAPFDATASKPISVTISETGGLPAGSAVDFVVMGGIVLDGGPNTAGLPRVVARGHVNADGLSIATDPGEGVRNLTWLAVVPAR